MVRLFFDSSESDLRSGQKGRRYMAHPLWSLEAVFALTLVPRPSQREKTHSICTFDKIEAITTTTAPRKCAKGGISLSQLAAIS